MNYRSFFFFIHFGGIFHKKHQLMYKLKNVAFPCRSSSGLLRGLSPSQRSSPEPLKTKKTAVLIDVLFLSLCASPCFSVERPSSDAGSHPYSDHFNGSPFSPVERSVHHRLPVAQMGFHCEFQFSFALFFCCWGIFH